MSWNGCLEADRGLAQCKHSQRNFSSAGEISAIAFLAAQESNTATRSACWHCLSDVSVGRVYKCYVCSTSKRRKRSRPWTWKSGLPMSLQLAHCSAASYIITCRPTDVLCLAALKDMHVT